MFCPEELHHILAQEVQCSCAAHASIEMVVEQDMYRVCVWQLEAILEVEIYWSDLSFRW